MSGFSERPILTFALAGLVSGICSGAIPIIGPMLLPGGLFGLALLFAISVCVHPLESGRGALLVIGSLISYFFAIVIVSTIYTSFGFSNEESFLETQLLGAAGGMVGAFILALSVYVACDVFRQVSFVILVTFAGSAFGAFSYSAYYYLGLREHSLLLCILVIWQVGVAGVIGAYAGYAREIAGAKTGLKSRSGLS